MADRIFICDLIITLLDYIPAAISGIVGSFKKKWQEDERKAQWKAYQPGMGAAAAAGYPPPPPTQEQEVAELQRKRQAGQGGDGVI